MHPDHHEPSFGYKKLHPSLSLSPHTATDFPFALHQFYMHRQESGASAAVPCCGPAAPCPPLLRSTTATWPRCPLLFLFISPSLSEALPHPRTHTSPFLSQECCRSSPSTPHVRGGRGARRRSSGRPQVVQHPQLATPDPLHSPVASTSVSTNTISHSISRNHRNYTWI